MTLATRDELLDDLRGIVGPAGLLTSPDELLVYECDGFSVARGTPRAVAFPTTTEQVAACVRTLRKHGVGIVPRGSGTGLAGGCVAFDGQVILCTSRMTRIESIDLANRVAVAQAGVLNVTLSEAVAAEVARWNREHPSPLPGAGAMHFSPDPSSQRASTVGGNAATNAGGINTLKHGVTSNHVLGVEFVLPDGQVVRTRRAALHESPGPDLTGLLCGSEGTLGILTKVWCRLTPKPVHFRTVYTVYTSTFDACKSVSDIIAAGILPTSMEVMDGRMIRVVEDAFHYGFPTDAAALLLIEIDGVDSILDEQLERIMAICRANGARDIQHCSDPKRRAELWSARKRAFGAIGRLHTAYFTQDACIPRSRLPEAVERIVAIGAEHGLKISNVFHAGDGNVHPIFFFDESNAQEVQRTIEAAERVLQYCIDIGGTITGEHGVGVEKLAMMNRMFNPATIDTFQKLKATFDPDAVLNDGKLIPSKTLRIELHRLVSPNVPGGAL
ncbi:MAG: FAD-binding protein [Phycisphaeraceae bacterium]|nr:FAD-binding protein [Phycisphaeraceae bacterium]